MSHPPHDHEDPDLNPGSYGFSEPEPPKREGPPIRYDKFAVSEPDEEKANDPDSNEPKPPKRRRDLAFEPPPEPTAEPLIRQVPWWQWTLGLSSVGLLGLIAAAVTLGVNQGWKMGVFALVASFFGVIIETVAVAIILMLVGIAFGIDYGPVLEASWKLVGCVLFVNGFTLALGLIFVSCFGLLGILVAVSTISIVSFGVLQAQFRLNVFEAIVSVFAIQGSACVMAAGLGFAFMNRSMSSTR
jgi:hypothetical protein